MKIVGSCSFTRGRVGLSSSGASLAVDNLDVEDEVGVGWDSWLLLGSVSGGGWATNVGLLTDAELKDGVLPALHDSEVTDSEGDGLATRNR